MSSEHEREDRPWFTDGKNVLILILALVALVQGFLLFRQGPDPDLSPRGAQPLVNATAPETGRQPDTDTGNATATPPEQAATPTPEVQPEPGPRAVEITGVSLESDKRRFLLVAFNQPVGLEKVGRILQRSPATMYPPERGAWSWISPYTLRLDFERPLPMGKEYSLHVDPEAITGAEYELQGDTGFSVRTHHFEVSEFTLEENFANDTKGSVYLQGNIEFTYPVQPRELLKHLACVDPKRGNNTPLPIELTTTYETRWIDFRTAPVQKELEPRTLRCTVSAGLPGASEEVRLSGAFSAEYVVQLDPRLKVLKADAGTEMGRSSLRLTFSSPVRPEAAGKYLSVEPEVRFSLSASGRDLELTGDFAPGRSYSLRVEKGLTAADTALLEKSFATTLQMPDLPPSVRFKDPGMFLAQGVSNHLAVESANADKAVFFIDRVYVNNLFSLLQEYSSRSFFESTGYKYDIRHFLGDRIVEHELALPGGHNEVRASTLDVERYIEGNRPGFYRIFLGLEDEWEGSQRWVLLTDLGVVAKKAEDEVMVWVNSFETLEPVSGASISLVSDQNQVLAQGVTDDRGLWHGKDLAASFEKHTPFMVLVEKGEDMSFLLFDQFRVDTTGQDVGGVTVPKKGYMAYLHGERDLYRPGETLRGLAILRGADLGTPPAMPLQMIQKGPKATVLSKKVFSSDERGLVEFGYEIPAFALTGDYTLELLAAEQVVGTYRYKVEEFVPDRIKVEIAPEKESYSPGQALTFDVAGRYFFGPPASGLPVESKVRLMAAPFAPKGFEAFQFGDPEREFEEQSLSVGTPDDLLDDEGRHSFSVRLPEALTPPAALDAMLFARVSERGGRGVAAMQSVRVHAYPRYPGLRRLEDRGVSPGDQVQVDYAVLSPDGQPLQGADLRVEVFRDRWQTVLRHTPSGGYRYESVRDSELVSTERLTNAPGKGQLKVTPTRHGSYRLRLTDEEGGAGSQVSFYAGGWGYSPWAIENPARLELEPGKDEYAPGETATIQVRAPFAGRLLVTVEGDGVLDVQVLSLAEGENTAEVRLPVTEAYSPNVYVSAILVRTAAGLESGAPARAFGSAPLAVNRTANMSMVKITAPEQIRPETKLEVTLQAEPGAVVTLAAVDEGILQLIAQKTPDPFPHFYAKRALKTESFDIYSMLFPDVKPSHGLAPVGGDGGLDRLRQFVRSEGLRRVKPVAFWSGPLVADQDGKVSFSFDVPEFQGALRLMAVASRDRRFGSAEAFTRVRSPLVLTPTLPRFLAPGDEVLVPVTLRNDTDSDGSFRVTLAVRGPAVVENEEIVFGVGQGREKLAYFKVRAGEQTGDLRFDFSASGNEETATAVVELGIRPALPARTLVDSGSLDSTNTEIAPQGRDMFLAEGLERELHVGATPLLRFTAGLKQLLGYPYGCLEQTTSKAFPLLYFDALAQVLDAEAVAGNRPAAMVQEGIQQIMTMQLHTGGFSMWPGGETPWEWGSVYATHFLLDAVQAGFQVSETALKLALDYVESLQGYQKEPGRDDLERKAYALFVLAKAGRPDRGGMDYMRRQYQGQLTPEGGALLAAAHGLLGETRFMNELMAASYSPRVQERETGGNLASPIRNLALRLAVTLDTAPDSRQASALVQELTTLLDATPLRSTQENGLSFVALGRFFAMQQQKAPFTGAVYLGDTKLGEFSSEKALHQMRIPGHAPLRIEVDSGFTKGSVFYSVLTRGVPRAEAYAPVSEGMEISSRLLQSDGAPIPSAGLRQGALVVLETSVKSLRQPIRNVVLQSLLPAGLEVENPRLETTERLPWAERQGAKPDYQDLRDDRVLLFLDLPGAVEKDGTLELQEQTYYSLLRAVAPGSFALPPVQAEAMYDPTRVASGETGRLSVLPDDPEAVVQPAMAGGTDEEPAGGDAPAPSGVDGDAAAMQTAAR